MERDLGKLFIGGISWDTDETKLREYFGQYGEILEAVIMRDRITGRARGFGFIVFADAVVAERVVMEKHIIDGRTVEAKKAVPRDDHQFLSKNTNSIQGSPAPGRTKKIFVGGLASTVTEPDFKNYFDEFGNIVDVVVMYDHTTQRPRGFGFITYDSEDAVDRVLQKTFHELNGKMVEVKRAVPRESSPSPNRSPLVAYNYGMSRAINPIGNHAQRYNPNSIGGYGRYNPLVSGQSGLPPLGNFGYGMGMGVGLDQGKNAGYSANTSLTDNHNYGRILGPHFDGNLNRYNTPIGYNGGIARGDSLGSFQSRNLWGNGSFNDPTDHIIPDTFLGSSNGNFGVSHGNGESNWGSTQTGGRGSGYSMENLGNGFIDNGYGFIDNGYGLGSGNYGRSHVMEPSHASTYGELHRSASAYGDNTWRSGSPDLDVSASFGFGISNTRENVASKSSGDVMGRYSAINRPANRGIAA